MIIGDELHVPGTWSATEPPPPLPEPQPALKEETSAPDLGADTMSRDAFDRLLYEKHALEARLREEEQSRLDAEQWRRHADKTVDERQADIEKLAEIVRQREASNGDLEAKVQEVEEQLRLARDHIFRLQPQRTEITETEAAASFQVLYENVRRFVQNRLQRILSDLDSGVLENHTPRHLGDGTNLLDLVRGSARTWFEARESDEFHVIAAVMEYLRRVIFDKPFYCPLGSAEENRDRTIQLIEKTAASMAKLPRGLYSHFFHELLS